MHIKKKFELVYRSDGAVYNIVPLSRGTLSAYEVDKDTYNHLYGLTRAYGREKHHPASKLIEKTMNSCMIVNLPSYPLPGFVTKRDLAVLNLASLPSTMLTDYTPVDIFSLFLYSISLRSFIKRKAIKDDSLQSVYFMLFSTLMSLYGKKAGLIGSYSHLIPKLRFLTLLYVNCAMFGNDQKDRTIDKLSNWIHGFDASSLNLDFDFSSTREFLKAINTNNIISLSEHTFSTAMINRAGITSLPYFEDVSRFYATLLASTVFGSSVFSAYYVRINKSLYPKLVSNGFRMLQRAV